MVAFRQFGSALCLAQAFLFLLAADAPASVTPGTLQIQIVGLDFSYDTAQNGSLFDSTSIAGGHGLIAESTRVSHIDFFLDDALCGSLYNVEGLYVDFLIDNIYNIPAGGGTVNVASNGPGFGFNLLSSQRGQFLSLDLDAVSVTYIRFQRGSTLLMNFIAGGPSASLVSQNLPFGLTIDEGQPITVRISTSTLDDITTQDGYLTGFESANGTANVYGQTVPEPQSFVALLALGLIFLELSNWRRRRRKRS